MNSNEAQVSLPIALRLASALLWFATVPLAVSTIAAVAMADISFAQVSWYGALLAATVGGAVAVRRRRRFGVRLTVALGLVMAALFVRGVVIMQSGRVTMSGVGPSETVAVVVLLVGFLAPIGAAIAVLPYVRDRG